MINLDEKRLAELEQAGFEIARDADGKVTSITQIIDPGPLILSDEEYIKDLFYVQGIMRAMHTSEADDNGEA